ncbi:hypothetical protein ACSSS7_001634 [Eimeria intestinalis]
MTEETRASRLATLWRGLVASGSIDESSSPRSDCSDTSKFACTGALPKLNAPSSTHASLSVDLEAKDCSEVHCAGLGASTAAPAFSAAGGKALVAPLHVGEPTADATASEAPSSPPGSYAVQSLGGGCVKEAAEELIGRPQTRRSSTTCSGSSSHGVGVPPASVEEGDLYGAVETLSQEQSCSFPTTAIDFGLDNAAHAVAKIPGGNGGGLPTQTHLTQNERPDCAPRKKLLGRLLRTCSVLHFLGGAVDRMHADAIEGVVRVNEVQRI